MVNYLMYQMENITPLSVEQIVDAVTRHFNFRSSVLMTKRRNASLVLARHIIWWLADAYTCLSLVQIARQCGDWDHTTIMYGRDRINKLRDTDQKVVDILKILEADLGVCWVAEGKKNSLWPLFEVHPQFLTSCISPGEV